MFRQEQNNDILTELTRRDDEATLYLLIDLATPLDNLLQDHNRHHPPSHSVTGPDSLEPVQVGRARLSLALPRDLC